MRLPNDIQPAQVIGNFSDISAKIDVMRWENGTIVPKPVPQTVISTPAFVPSPSIPQNPPTSETPVPSTNKAPIVVMKPKDSTVRVGEDKRGTILPVFQDPDGDKMTFAATADNPDLLEVTLTDEAYPTAKDPHGASASTSFNVSPKPEA